MQLRGRHLRVGMAGPDVSDLHQDLMRLGFAVPAEERQGQSFGVVTARSVAAFQTSHRLLDTAVVDEPTALALTRAVFEAQEQTLLVRQARPDTEPGPPATPPELASDSETRPAVGRVRRPSDLPDAVTPPPPGGPASATPTATQRGEEPLVEPADPRLRRLAARFLELGEAEKDPEGHEVAGKIYFSNGRPAGGATIRLYHRGFGDDRRLLGEQIVAADGGYQLGYDPGAHPANLEVRLVTDDGEVTLNNTAFQAAPRESLTLVAPATALAPEWQRIQDAVRPYLGQARLGDSQEAGERADVTLLGRSTGWDSRVLALAASADALARETGVDPQALYGALRCGLPASPAQLAQVAPETFAAATEHAAQATLISLSTKDIEAATVAFARFARETRRATIAPGALSSHGAMMTAAGLTREDQDRFDEVLLQTSQESLWQRAERAGLPAARLRVTGKLGYLTGNNSALTAELARRIENPEQLGDVLAGQRLYTPSAWEERIGQVAGRDGVDALVPPAYPGTPPERLAAYTRDLARKVRLSYPTQVAAAMVAARELPLDGSVATVLTRATAKGFTLGRTPLHSFAREHGETLFAGMDSEQITTATAQTATLQRIFQLSPSDNAMRVLLESGFTSAQQITAMSRRKFLDRIRPKLQWQIEADLIWRRAEQISMVVHTFFGSAQQAATQPPVFAMAPSDAAAEEAKDHFLKQYPTMEALFGSQDYAESDHCRSVLSPAAYLVDLLKFLDPSDDEWAYDLTEWKSAHGGAPYPFPDLATWNDYAAEVADPVKELTPFEVLSLRRPDIPELQLTCENTHTVLPYIDLTNEILEYWIAHGELNAGAAHNHTTEVTADLLAEPQQLIPSVYDQLSAAAYPLDLPFDLWRATVTEFLDHFDTPLWRLLTVAGAADDEVVALERLGLPPADQDLLTVANPWATWHQLYGYPTEALALTELRSAKKLARRLRVSYKELVSLVKAGFVNPKLDTLVALRRLGVDVEDVMRYKEQPGYAPFSPLEKADFAALIAAKGGTAWLDSAWTAGEFGQVLVLADPSGGPGFDTTTLRYANGTPADAEAFLRLNYLTRLWRKLGWGIEETDRALCVFRPAGPVPATMREALLGLARLHALTGVFGSGTPARRKALFLFADLDDRRYRELFLTRSILSTDPVFDNPDGRYLTYTYDPTLPEDPATNNVSLASHLGAVKAALKLTTEEVSGLVDLATAPLSMPVLSVLHRWSLLAKALRLKVSELIGLRDLSGLDPFTESFVDLARDLVPLTVADLDYVVRDRFDPVGPLRSTARPPYASLRQLAAEIGRIDTEHADRPLLDSELRAKLVLVLPAEVADTTMAVLAGTAQEATAKPSLTRHLVELGFLTTGQLDGLFAAPAPGLDPAAAQQFADAKRATLATVFLPHLRGKLIRAAIAEALGPLAGVVLTDVLYDAFAAAGERGFDVTGNDSDGWIQVPVNGTYVLATTASNAATAISLTLDHLADPVIQATTAGAQETLSAEVELTAGTLYRLTLTASAPVSLTLAGGGQPAGQLTNVYPHTMVQAFWDAHRYVSKVLLVAERLELREAELAHLLPTLSPLTATAVLDTLSYARLRDEIGADPTDLVELLSRAQRSFPGGADPTDAGDEVLADLSARLAAMTRRGPDLVLAAARLDPAPVESVVDGDRLRVTARGFATASALRRVWEVLVLAQRLGAGVDALARWAVARPGFEIARDLRDTVKARYELQTWQRVAQPINDRLRKQRRDALVSWVLHHHPAGFERLDQLFEYFLIDPGMEPVVQTSRLRLALSSVQTFIQRGLLNLERQVHPSALNAGHWEWMKRYRVWEANRKIFLWPENWLHPEFRDDKSHLFTALESAMMEADLTEDIAERAFYDYLLGLEEIARLDVRSVYLQELADPGDNIVHVVGRTYAAPHTYFYRTYQHRMWSPWQPVPVEIESDHLAAVVWRGRIHLFWVTFLDKHDRQQENRTPVEMLNDKVSTADMPRIAQLHLHWTELFQGQWTEPSQTSQDDPIEVTVPYNFRPRREMIHVTRDTADGADALLIHVSGKIDRTFRLASKLAAPHEGQHEDHPPVPYPVIGPTGEWVGITPLNVTFITETESTGWIQSSEHTDTRTILGKQTGYRLRLPANRTERLPATLAGLVSPFFYQHRDDTFFVLPELTERTLVEYDDWVTGIAPATEIGPGGFHDVGPLIEAFAEPDPIGPIARFEIETPRDWLVKEGTVVHFGERAFGQPPTQNLNAEGIV